MQTIIKIITILTGLFCVPAFAVAQVFEDGTGESSFAIISGDYSKAKDDSKKGELLQSRFNTSSSSISFLYQQIKSKDKKDTGAERDKKDKSKSKIVFRGVGVEVTTDDGLGPLLTEGRANTKGIEVSGLMARKFGGDKSAVSIGVAGNIPINAYTILDTTNADSFANSVQVRSGFSALTFLNRFSKIKEHGFFHLGFMFGVSYMPNAANLTKVDFTNAVASDSSLTITSRKKSGYIGPLEGSLGIPIKVDLAFPVVKLFKKENKSVDGKTKKYDAKRMFGPALFWRTNLAVDVGEQIPNKTTHTVGIGALITKENDPYASDFGFGIQLGEVGSRYTDWAGVKSATSIYFFAGFNIGG